jgi:hypothetical protein
MNNQKYFMHLTKSSAIAENDENIPVESTTHQKKMWEHDLVQNIRFPEAIVRFGFTILIPMLMLGIDKHLIIYTAPLIAYLFITALARFCVVKYVWHRYIKHEPARSSPAYGKDPDYPEESAD